MATSGILRLPNELLINISKLVHPRDIESFSVMCKCIYEITEDAMKDHRENERRYSVNRARNLSPEIARELSVSKVIEAPKVSDDEIVYPWPGPDDDPIDQMISRSPLINESEKESWQSAIKKGRIDKAFCPVNDRLT